MFIFPNISSAWQCHGNALHRTAGALSRQHLAALLPAHWCAGIPWPCQGIAVVAQPVAMAVPWQCHGSAWQCLAVPGGPRAMAVPWRPIAIAFSSRAGHAMAASRQCQAITGDAMAVSWQCHGSAVHAVVPWHC